MVEQIKKPICTFKYILVNWCSDICAIVHLKNYALCMENFILNDMYSSSTWCMFDLCLGARNILVPLPFIGGTHPDYDFFLTLYPTHLNHYFCR